MEIKNKEKFKQYYAGILKCIQANRYNIFAELKTPEEQLDAIIDSGFWTVKSLSDAKEVNRRGLLNVGICPICGDSPIPTRQGPYHYSYYWSWYNGPSVYLCKSCFDIGIKEYHEFEKSIKRKNSCYIATVCYGDPLCENVLVLKWYRDNILMKSRAGRYLVSFYYLVSPSISKFLEQKNSFNRFLKKVILDPIVLNIKKKYLKTSK